jgi:hypothetical protein
VVAAAADGAAAAAAGRGWLRGRCDDEPIEPIEPIEAPIHSCSCTGSWYCEYAVLRG